MHRRRVAVTRPPARRRPPGRRLRRPAIPPWWAVAALTVVAALLRFLTLDVQSFWYDEIITARFVRHELFAMLERLPDRAHPPLYYLLAWPWSRLFGTGEVGLRSLSALLGTATVPVAYLAGVALASRRVGLVLAALVALSPFMVWYSQEARAYALLVLLTALSFLCLVRALGDPRVRWLIAWAVFSALSVLTHYHATLFVGVAALLLLLAHRARLAALAAVAAVGATAVATLPLALAQIGGGNVDWIGGLKLVPRMRETLNWFLGGPYLGLHQPLGGAIALLWLLEALLAGAGIYLLVRRASTRERSAAALAAAIGLGTISLALLLALAGHDFILGRYLIPAWVPLTAAIAVGFGTIRSPRAGATAATLACGLWVIVLAVTATTPRFQRDDWRGAASALGDPVGARLILVKGGAGSAPASLRFYMPGARALERGSAHIDELALVDVRRSRWAHEPTPPAGSMETHRLVNNNLRLHRFRFANRRRIALTTSSNRVPPGSLGLLRGTRCDFRRCLRGYLVDGVDGAESSQWRRRAPPPRRVAPVGRSRRYRRPAARTTVEREPPPASPPPAPRP